MTPLEALRRYYGHGEFREGQEEAIRRILRGEDLLGVMPTGSGKSVCFQIPALLSEGTALVISPLISLMRDQVSALKLNGVPAAYVNSSLTDAQIAKALRYASEGRYKLIYVAPERLLSGAFLAFAREAAISLIAVDEAHCISEWGHDFRPSYLRIPEFVARLPRRPAIAAFTATATERVRGDIERLLGLSRPYRFVTGFDRPNLRFEVREPRGKYEALSRFIEDRRERSGIVYCLTRRETERVCARLNRDGIPAARYHAGLSDEERAQSQEAFQYDRVRLVVATNAFGMGIDKSNVSFVVHYNMPANVERYYQEAGRAGRDGEPADCALFFSRQDIQTNLWLIDHSGEAEGAEGEAIDESAREEARARARDRLREMIGYCEAPGCLREYILRYFGESPPSACGNCLNCERGVRAVDAAVDARWILRCVRESGGRYGARAIVGALRGVRDESAERRGLTRLPSFGASGSSEPFLLAVVSELIRKGCLARAEGEYPILRLGPRAGEPVEIFPVARPRSEDSPPAGHANRRRASRRSASASAERPVDEALFEALKSLRLRISKELGVPAYVVFHDATLRELCEKRPKRKEELAWISGIGKSKAAQYGERFLRVIEGYERGEGGT